MNAFSYEYLPWRGVTADTFRHYGIQTKIDVEGKPVSLGFPYGAEDFKVRKLDEKQFFWVGKTLPGLFGKDKFAAGSSDSLTITEGELDAASLYQVLKRPVVSVQSSSSAARDVAADFDYVASFDKIYLAFDNDAAGKDALRKVARLFDYNRVWHVKFTNRKDANEYLQSGEGEVLLTVWRNARRYLPEQIVSSFADFRSILKEPDKAGIPYPFPTLTKMTYGIRKGETVLLKAPEKVGKTALMHAFEYNILKRTNDNVAAIYIEEPKLRHLQYLAGLELKKPVHLPDSDTSETEVMAAVESVVQKDDRLHLYSHFGTDDPDALLETIRFLVSARSVGYVLFDHITMAVSGLADEKSERRALEYLATRLEMMVKELNFALIMVSHVNDSGQTRGSHLLTKVADITIDASRDTLASDETARRTIQLSIPFNRYCAHTGPAGRIVFDPSTYVLTEDTGGTDD